MKCPKCSYISFDTPERCRNCGFDFSLVSPAEPPVDLPIRPTDSPVGPTPDLPLSTSRRREADPDEPPRARRASEAPTPGGLELPLFHEPVPGVDDTPLITSAPPPRPPLAVRRSSDTPRPGSTAREAAPRFEFTPDPAAVEEPEVAHEVRPSRRVEERRADVDAGDESLPLARRIGAAAIDLALVGVIDAAVLYFTLRLTGLGAHEVLKLPLLPLLGFFALLNGGYLVGFTTAAGQTIGQMLTGVRVVGAHADRVPLGQAIVRAVSLVISLLPLGLGLLPMFLADDRRALHDRLSGTLVRRA